MDTSAEISRAYKAFAERDYTAAGAGARRVLRESPQDPAALTLIGRLAVLHGEPLLAAQAFERVLGQRPGTSAVWLDLARALRDLGRHRHALDAANRALSIDQDDVPALVQLGEIHLALGEPDEAAARFRRALEIDPECIAAFRGLTATEEIDPAEEPVMRMEALSRSARLQGRDLAQLHYCLAQIDRRGGRDARFLDHLFKANACQRALSNGERAHYAAVFDRIEAAFSAETLANAARGRRCERLPIFILGMPRSGTTLVERIVGGHRDVAVGGEIDYMRGPLRREFERVTTRPFPEGFDRVPEQVVAALAEAYARRLELLGPHARYVTDKTPGNYHVLGLLPILFPDCRIIHVARDPLDTCFSILQHPFDDNSPHTCDVALLAYVYARYVRLMRRWETLCRGQFITVEYERLVTAPAAEGRRIFEFCGLDWSDDFLHVERATTAARTFSATQVRRPIYRSSVGAARAYEEALSPLRRALERELGRSEAGH